jgi:hypothetical protein
MCDVQRAVCDVRHFSSCSMWQCGSVRQCMRQCVAVLAAVCGCPAVRAAVCSCLAVQQCAAGRQSAALPADVCGSARGSFCPSNSACGSVH